MPEDINNSAASAANGAGTATDANAAGVGSTVDVKTTGAENPASSAEKEPGEESLEIANLKRELAKARAERDKAMQDAGNTRKELRKKQTAEEIAAEEKRIADEERDRKLADYEKRFAVAETSKKVMAFVGEEETATAIAEYLYGAADAEGAIDALQKAWAGKEKALRLEFGKIQQPGAGSLGGGEETDKAVEFAKRLAGSHAGTSKTFNDVMDFYRGNKTR